MYPMSPDTCNLLFCSNIDDTDDDVVFVVAVLLLVLVCVCDVDVETIVDVDDDDDSIIVPLLPANVDNNVVFPAPDGPNKPHKCPLGIYPLQFCSKKVPSNVWTETSFHINPPPVLTVSSQFFFILGVGVDMSS